MSVSNVSNTIQVTPGEFKVENHFYPSAINAQIHPIVKDFLCLDYEQIIHRYSYLHPQIDAKILKHIFTSPTQFLSWAGADLCNVTTKDGIRQMVLIETNSCPSGQKSMPILDPQQEQRGYRKLIELLFCPMLARSQVSGGLAVIYDKNFMEASGYATVMADYLNETVYLVAFHEDDPDPSVRFQQGVMEIRTVDHQWIPIRAALRYVTQRPWNRIPILTHTKILNPVITCLAGGRNKMLAAKAYENYNSLISNSGLRINTPETICDVSKEDIPHLVQNWDGQAVVKIPYANAGQGVFTIMNIGELNEFMEIEHHYSQFIVQRLIGNWKWQRFASDRQFFHIGTVPDRYKQRYVSDLRMMVGSSASGFYPLAIYARRARIPLLDVIKKDISSWDMLGTNLSIRKPTEGWDLDTNRLLTMNEADFSHLGLGLDDLINAFIQTVLGMVAIDHMAGNILTETGELDRAFFQSLNQDDFLLEEIL